ncbi:MAG: ABC transporter ATP-binding protein, partial [Chloroflexi bacterium]|nr:ABC transporter ATP-binding protein [Chloroflexota bacterium]
KAVLTSTHDLDLAMRSADRVWLMNRDGEVMQGAPEDLALDGSFGETFSVGKVHFDASTGQFDMNGKPSKQIALKAEGLDRIWAEKALSRIGYAVVESSDVLVEAKDARWFLHQQGQEQGFDTLYTLLQALNGRS